MLLPVQISSLGTEVQSLKTQLGEAGQSWEGQAKSLREELAQTSKRLEDQVAHTQEQLATLTHDKDKLQKELDKVRKHHWHNAGFCWHVALVCVNACLLAQDSDKQLKKELDSCCCWCS